MDYKSRQALKSYHKEFHHIISAALISKNLKIAIEHFLRFCRCLYICLAMSYPYCKSCISNGLASARFLSTSDCVMMYMRGVMERGNLLKK